MTETNAHGGINIMVGHTGEPDHCAGCLAFHAVMSKEPASADVTLPELTQAELDEIQMMVYKTVEPAVSELARGLIRAGWISAINLHWRRS